jgi:hypothetical protein
MPASRTTRPRQVIEIPLLLSRPLERHPGTDWALLLQGPDGAITGGFHQGRRLDAAQALALQRAHRWQEAGAVGRTFE